MVRINKLTNLLFGFLICIMPFQYYIFNLFLKKVPILSLTRDALIIVLIVLLLSRPNKYINKTDIMIAMSIFIIIIYTIFSIESIKYSPQTWNICRTYVMPMLIFFIGHNIDIDLEEYRKIMKLIVVEYFLISIYGIYQAFFLGADFLIKIGYPSQNGSLAGTSYYIGGFYGNQRAVGTFISPNIFSTLLVMVIVIAILNKKLLFTKNYMYYGTISVLILGLLSTFSRSAFLELIIVLLLSNLNKKIPIYKTLNYFIFCILIVGIFAIIDSLFFDKVFSNMLFSLIRNTFNNNDASASRHFQDLVLPVKIIGENIFGTGFGNGPMAISTNNNALTVENSYYLMFYDLGLFGGIIYFLSYIYTLVRCWNEKYQLGKLCKYIIIVTLINYIMLPNVQTFEVPFYTFLIMGLFYNKNLKEYVEKGNNI